ncbi:hypothetical protein [Lachnoclostridium phytofermentans]|uniref:Uncharacterized protein n=1 Tax=Lachnoclostridium phytofermentans (strain ATCC 700394 / DSM 18823 / ISDg) TaxID=357809 RepID=A9KKL3_LACP7|nr:hypothetical protein [Lachnoclostridium phytofermentans]ABX41184.1 hypothetical protein Cphy_0797 [Lachnoclostridium phytofermentans ISDg]
MAGITRTMDILVDFADTILYIAKDITCTVPEDEHVPIIWHVSEFLSVQDNGYRKYTVDKNTKVDTGTWRYNPEQGFFPNPDSYTPMDTEKEIMNIVRCLADMQVEKAESELEIDGRLSSIELGLA